MNSNPRRSEWRLFQLDYEFELCNIERHDLERIIERFSHWTQANTGEPLTPDAAMNPFCGQEFSDSPDKLLPVIPLDPAGHCPAYAVNFVPLETFVNRWSYRAGYAIDPHELIERLAERDEARRVSKDLAADRMKLGVGPIGHRYFWLGDQELSDPWQLCKLSTEGLRAILDRTGLPWQVRPSVPLRVLAIVIPLIPIDVTTATDIEGIRFGQLRVPTMFHAAWAYFESNENASVEWGRTIDLAKHSSETGVPEALCGEVDWQESFHICNVGELDDDYSSYGEDDFEKLLRNSWKGR